jgi:hypothetical protein
MANKILSSAVIYIVFSGIILSYYKPCVIKIIHVEFNYKVSTFIVAPFATLHASNSIKLSPVTTTSGG